MAGGRVDHFRETIGTVFSPRAALRFKPRPDQTWRLAAGRAYRSPSVIETDLAVPTIPVAILDWEEIDQQLIADGTISAEDFPHGFLALMARGICETQADNCGAPPGETPQYIAVTGAFGSRDLKEEVTDSIEVGWAARLGRFDLSATVYRTRGSGGIDFPVKSSYGLGADRIPGTADDVILPSDPDGDGIKEAPPVDVCPFGLELFTEFGFDVLCAQGPVTYNHALSIMLDGRIPARFEYDNRGVVFNRGVELGVSWNGPHDLSLWTNYSWQDDPRSDGLRMRDRIDLVRRETASGTDLDGDGLVADTADFVNIPAEHRLSLGAQIDRGRWFGAVSYDYVDRTFWQDVLTPDFWGFVPTYSLVGARGGWRWPDAGIELSAQVTNLLDDATQQHIYGDIIGRRVTLMLGMAWGGGGAAPAAP